MIKSQAWNTTKENQLYLVDKAKKRARAACSRQNWPFAPGDGLPGSDGGADC